MVPTSDNQDGGIVPLLAGNLDRNLAPIRGG
jgi:hypothetical protein